MFFSQNSLIFITEVSYWLESNRWILRKTVFGSRLMQWFSSLVFSRLSSKMRGMRWSPISF